MVNMTLRMTQNIFMPMKVNSSGISITLESVKIIRTEKCQQDSLNNHARVQEGWNAFLPAKISMLVCKMHHIAGQSYNNVFLWCSVLLMFHIIAVCSVDAELLAIWHEVRRSRGGWKSLFISEISEWGMNIYWY